MNYQTSKLGILELLQSNGMNKFEAVNYVSKYARKLTEYYKDNISHKETNEWKIKEEMNQ